jgi:voltage-gated potassium channel
VSWQAFAAFLVAHCLLSWLLMLAAGEDKLVAPVVWLYYYTVTATTVGYGDFSPQTDAGRLVAVLVVLPGGVSLFATLVGKITSHLAVFWRRRAMGKLDFTELCGHTILVGWHGEASERMVDLLLRDSTTDDEGIVLAVTQDMPNPLPERLRFVRGESFHSGTLLARAGLAGAARVLVFGHDDEENLATALSVLRSKPRAHVVCHFQDTAVARMLKELYPQVEITSALAVEMLVRAAQDPGISAVTNELLSPGEGATQYALTLPEDFPPTPFGKLFVCLKERHDATALGVSADPLGNALKLNPATDEIVAPLHTLYYLAHRRLDPTLVRHCV